jgi:dihydrofolate synthase/folylpolyglutamate synthase
VREARVAGRLQVLGESPQILVDVAHNPQAAGQLADWLQAHPRPTRAVFSALADKDIEAIVARIDPWVSHWYLAGIDDAGARGLSATALAQRLAGPPGPERRSIHGSIGQALASACADSAADERVLVFGSFHTVAEALKAAAPGRERV